MLGKLVGGGEPPVGLFEGGVCVCIHIYMGLFSGWHLSPAIY